MNTLYYFGWNNLGLIWNNLEQFWGNLEQFGTICFFARIGYQKYIYPFLVYVLYHGYPRYVYGVLKADCDSLLLCVTTKSILDQFVKEILLLSLAAEIPENELGASYELFLARKNEAVVKLTEMDMMYLRRHYRIIHKTGGIITSNGLLPPTESTKIVKSSSDVR